MTEQQNDTVEVQTEEEEYVPSPLVWFFIEVFKEKLGITDSE